MLIRCLLSVVLVFQVSLALPYGLEPKITDGEDALPNEFPHQVSIQYGLPPIIPFNHICGGSILNKNYILTAGHCIINILGYGKLRVVAGKHVLLKTESTQQVRNVAQSHVHDQYPGGAAPYDIAILRLSTPLIFNEEVSAVRLPRQDEVRTGNVVLSGWGSTSKNILPTIPKVLQKATIPLLDNKTCLKKLEGLGRPVELFDTQICTDAVKETSACSGDSGSPLVQYDGRTPTQLGIVSWGVFPCGRTSSPSVYTRVSSYIDWIRRIIT